MSIATANGSKIYIGENAGGTAPEAGTPANQTAYEALNWQEVGEIEDLGEIGDESNDVTFASLDDNRTRHLKGVRDAGVLNLVVADDPADTGQGYMVTAEGSTLDYPFKIEGNDKLTTSGDNSVIYFYGKVMSKRKNIGSSDNVVRRNFNIGINSPLVEVDPT